jgi:Fic family protein
MGGRWVARTWGWNLVLHAPAKYRRACRYEAFVPDPLGGGELALSSAEAGAVSEAEQALMSLNAMGAVARGPLARLLLRTESIASSKVEGMQVGIRQLTRAESRLETGGRASPTIKEVLGNIDSMQLAVDTAVAGAPIGIDHVTHIHRTLTTTAAHAQTAGVVRTGQNWIGGNDYNPCGADFVPPPPECVAPLLEDLCAAIDDDTLPPVVQAALVHAQFETIHPFDDGNGRVGRALVHVVLKRRGLATSYVPPISVVLAAQRDRYIEGLIRFRSGEVGRWIEQFAAATTRAARLAASYLDGVAGLVARWRGQLSAGSAPRADAAAWAVIDVLPAHPVITARAAGAATGRAKAAIHNALAQLVECGVLLPLSQSKRNRSWEAAGLLDLLEGLEAAAPIEVSNG